MSNATLVCPTRESVRAKVEAEHAAVARRIAGRKFFRPFLTKEEVEASLRGFFKPKD